MWLDVMILLFWMLSSKLGFSFSSFTLIKRLLVRSKHSNMSYIPTHLLSSSLASSLAEACPVRKDQFHCLLPLSRALLFWALPFFWTINLSFSKGSFISQPTLFPTFKKVSWSLFTFSVTLPLLQLLHHPQSHFYPMKYWIIPSLFHTLNRLHKHILEAGGRKRSQITRQDGSENWKTIKDQDFFLSIFCFVLFLFLFLFLDVFKVFFFLHSSVDKESVCDAGDPSLISGSGRCTGEGKYYPLQYSGLENCIVHGITESDITESLSLSLSVYQTTVRYREDFWKYFAC